MPPSGWGLGMKQLLMNLMVDHTASYCFVFLGQ